MATIRDLEARETELIQQLVVVAASLESVRRQKLSLQQQQPAPPPHRPQATPPASVPKPAMRYADVDDAGGHGARAVSVAFVWAGPGRVDLAPLQHFMESKARVRWDVGPDSADIVVFVVVVGPRFDPVERLRQLHASGAPLACAVPPADSDERLLPARSAIVGEHHDFRHMSTRHCVLALAPVKQGEWASSLGGLWVAGMLCDPASGAVRVDAASAAWLCDAVAARQRAY